ncbi:hypothetical protein KX729_05170 [Rhizobium sp. XQZ8]|uniref:hypothetical protein n=1 Tax=Rhizobium populisoli TaxID=2859785 RepID=UPI001CA556A3|nr:hypothetical protein [Rhizobium populisoli]MBW6420826.1 hypothetical protein [Rhizobium populisoli]
MIDDLAVAKAASFFVVKKRISAKAVEALFVTLRANYDVSAHNIFKHTRKVQGTARWSAICFTYQAPPSFLVSTTDVRETLCGYLLLVEYQSHAAVFASRISLPTSFKTAHFSPVPVERVEGAIAKGDAVFQRMRMRNMSVSQFAMRNKTLEAPNLATVVGPAGSRRYALQTYTVTVNGTHSTATPNTGRIAVRSDRVGLDELIDFAEDVLDAVRLDPVDVSSFIRSFARPVSLPDALNSSEPITMAIDTSALVDAVTGAEATVRLIHAGDNPVELTTAELNALIAQLDVPLDIVGDARVREARVSGTNIESALISLNKSRISLRSLSLSPAADVEVESLSMPLGEDPERRSLQRYLDETDALIVLFDDFQLAYINGQVFRDEGMQGGGTAFLRYLHPNDALSGVTSEKGNFAAAQVSFEATSSFGAIVDHIAAADEILICDDLGDEWADFIGIRENDGVTQVSFYHAKHGDLSLGAGPFHIAVSQAIKNLANMSFPEERMAAKVLGWGNTYNAPGHATQIPRTIRSNAPDLLNAVARARNAPEALRRATIVTSSLSKQAVEQAFAEIQTGQPPPPSFVQLYWLLQSFFSACTEVGATGSIVCRP